jgi:hypothetical protein
VRAPDDPVVIYTVKLADIAESVCFLSLEGSGPHCADALARLRKTYDLTVARALQDTVAPFDRVIDLPTRLLTYDILEP